VSCLWLRLKYRRQNTVVCVRIVVVRSWTFGSATRRHLRLLLFVLEDMLVVVEAFPLTIPEAFTLIKVDIRTADYQLADGCIGLAVARERTDCTTRRAPAEPRKRV